MSDFEATTLVGDDEPTPSSLGSCCACSDRGPTVTNILMLSQKAPLAGRGWGCLLCDLPSDGAIAVVCDRCLESDAPLLFACCGWPGEDGRVPIGSLAGSQHHDRAAHAAADAHEQRAPFYERGDGGEDDPLACREDDTAECSALSGGTAHRPCAHCGAETGCVPVLVFRDRGEEDTDMWAVCDDCLVKEYRLR